MLVKCNVCGATIEFEEGAAAGSTMTPFMKRGFLALEDGEWEKADGFFENALNQDAENAEAYLGKLMAEMQIGTREQLADCAEPFDDRKNFKKVIRFGNEAIKNEMHGYIAHIINRNENARIEYEQRVDGIVKAIVINHPLFETYINKLQAEIAFLEKKLNEFSAGVERLPVIEEKLKVLVAQKWSLNSSIENLGAIESEEKAEINERINKLDKELNSFRKELQMIESEVDKFKSVSNIESLIGEKQKELDKLIANSALNSNISFTSEEALKELSNDEALRKAVFAAYPSLKDIHIFEFVKEIIKFGNYPQTSNENEVAPIEWIVLAKENGKALVISKYALDYQEYCDKFGLKFTDSTWENCPLRNWMNFTFLNKAFSSEEQKKIAITLVNADKNPIYGTNAGNATLDKIFLLSIAEAEKYFAFDEARQCSLTAYAKLHSAGRGVKGNCYWSLRSPGGCKENAAYVNADGSVDCAGTFKYDIKAIRPAMWLDLE